jgi:hypothetical protein
MNPDLFKENIVYNPFSFPNSISLLPLTRYRLNPVDSGKPLSTQSGLQKINR